VLTTSISKFLFLLDVELKFVNYHQQIVKPL